MARSRRRHFLNRVPCCCSPPESRRWGSSKRGTLDLRASEAQIGPLAFYRRRPVLYQPIPPNGLSLVKSRTGAESRPPGTLRETSRIQGGLYWTRFPRSDQRHTRWSLSVCHDIFTALTSLLPLRAAILYHQTTLVCTTCPGCENYDCQVDSGCRHVPCGFKGSSLLV